MPEIEIRPAIASDIPHLVVLDHSYITDQVWQMEFRHDRDENQVRVNFRQVRLPRSVRVEYPRPPTALATEWSHRSGILVALLKEKPIGYASLVLDIAPSNTWVSDLVIDRALRRKGVASALLLAAMEWATDMGCQNLLLEMQPKNHPAINLALKLGFEFCGYNDRHYANHEIGILFGKALR